MRYHFQIFLTLSLTDNTTKPAYFSTQAIRLIAPSISTASTDTKLTSSSAVENGRSCGSE